MTEFVYRVIIQELGVDQRDDAQILQVDLHVQITGLPLIVNLSRCRHYSDYVTGHDNEEATWSEHHRRHRDAVASNPLERRLKNVRQRKLVLTRPDCASLEIFVIDGRLWT